MIWPFNRKMSVNDKPVVVDLENAEVVKYPRTPFVLAIERMVKPDKNHWGTIRCAVHRCTDSEGLTSDNQVVSFEYNYSSGIKDIFQPFMSSDGKWYCLYTEKYTQLSLARLDGGFEHLDSTTGGSDGFCPVECAIPWELKYENKYIEDPAHKTCYDYSFDPIELMSEYEDGTEESGHLRHTDFGFYCGCVWGDDTSWKLKFLDLRQVPEGKLLVDEAALGYHPLPRGLSIKKAVQGFWIDPATDFVQFDAAKEVTYRRVKVKDGTDNTYQWKTFQD
jgi:hypothetical protein